MSLSLRQIALSCVLFFVPLQAFAERSVTIFAAASLQTALHEIAKEYGGQIVLSFGGSGQIARQVGHGAPADIVFLAHPGWMDWLDQEGHLAPDTRANVVGNALVVAGKSGADPIVNVSAATLLSRLQGGRLAVGDTRAVPAGIYAKQWFENIGVWADLRPVLAETQTVRAALALVERGETALGVVYRTDVAAAVDVVSLYSIPGTMHDPIVYPVAITRGKTAPHVTEFMAFLLSDASFDIFASHGFSQVVSR